MVMRLLISWSICLLSVGRPDIFIGKNGQSLQKDFDWTFILNSKIPVTIHSFRYNTKLLIGAEGMFWFICSYTLVNDFKAIDIFRL